MDIRTKFILAVLGGMESFLKCHFFNYNEAPAEIADEIEAIAKRIKKTTDALQIRHYLLNYIGSTSSFWRTIAPYTYRNKLLSYLEKAVNSDEFTVHSIHMAQITELHEHYLVKQKELIEPLHAEIYRLQKTCNDLQKTITALRDENVRLRIENDFLLKEMVSLHENLVAETESKIKETKDNIKKGVVKPISATTEIHTKTSQPAM